MIKLIVGLSNPGVEYKETRHNIGAWYVNLLAEYYQQPLKKESALYGYTGQLTINNQNIHLLIPNTFMNLSGKAVVAMTKLHQLYGEDILVAHDELDLLPGNIKLKLNGGHGGHNGLKDIISCLGNNSQFYRLRIGIGHPGDKNQVKNFVLSKPLITERQLIYKAINKAIHCTEILINHNIMQVMNCLHSKHLR